MSNQTLAELRARREVLDKQVRYLDSLGISAQTEEWRQLRASTRAELGEVSKAITKAEKLQFREVVWLPKCATPSEIESMRNKAALVHEDTATYIPQDSMPNLVLTSGIIPACDRATVLRTMPKAMRKMSHDKRPYQLANGRDEVLYYSGPHLGSQDRDTLVLLLARAAKHALPPPGPDGVEVLPREYITISARELVEASGREYNTNNRRTMIESVLRWSDVTLTLAKLGPTSKSLADASEIFASRLITLNRISQRLDTNSAEISFSVPATAARFFGFRDFSFATVHLDKPPMVSFLLDQFGPHATDWVIKASDLWRVSQSNATFYNFDRKLHEAYAWLIEHEGYVVEKRNLADPVLVDELGTKGKPVVGYSVRMSRPNRLPAYSRDAEKWNQRRGQWYRYVPLDRKVRGLPAKISA